MYFRLHVVAASLFMIGEWVSSRQKKIISEGKKVQQICLKLCNTCNAIIKYIKINDEKNFTIILF